jgi:heme-degrading monooxygenase HmoA
MEEAGGWKVFARVISTRVMPDNVERAIRVSREQIGDARIQHGFKGFYLLIDRDTGKVMTISLWESADDVRAVEVGAAQVRQEAASNLNTAIPAVDVYEVAIQA